MIDYRKFKTVYHKQQNKFGTIIKFKEELVGTENDADTTVIELHIDWDQGGSTHLYASQYRGKFLDRFDFFDYEVSQKEKLVILLRYGCKKN